jgi:phosphatidyl-myo-inositol alpha-mannosyltransferase
VRIALVCPYAWEDAGGVQVHVRELAERLLARTHDVVVLAPVRTRAPQPWVVPIGTPVDIPYNASNAPIDPRPWSRRAVRRQLDRFAPDVVHVHQPTAPSTGLWALLEARAPVVATFHSGATRARLYDVAAPFLRRAARRLAVRIAVTEHAAAFERARIGGEFEVIPNGVDVARFADAAPADLGPGTKILFVGRLDERKGFSYAVAAFGILSKERTLRLIVAGDGPGRDAIERLPVATRALVSMLGHVRNENLPPIYSACDVFVAPNVGGESFGMVLTEAMAAGVPVVATDIPGFDEVMTAGVDGLLVPPRDADALATAVARLLDEPELVERLVADARTRAAWFDWSIVAEQIEAVYRRAIDAGRPSLR